MQVFRNIDPRKNRIIFILMIAFLLRFILFFFAIQNTERYITSSDSENYNSSAINILEHRVYSPFDQPPFTPGLYYPPLYSLFLSFYYYVFNYNIPVVLFFQVIIGVLTVYFVYKLGVYFFDQRVGQFSALILAIDPVSIVYTTQLLTETFFTFLLILAMYFFVLAINKDKLLHLTISGFLLSLCALTRPISLYFPLFLVPIIIYKFRKNISQIIGKVMVFVLVFSIPVGSWVMRNYFVSGKPIFATVIDDTFLYYKAVSIIAYKSAENDSIVRDGFREKYPLDLINDPEGYNANVKMAKDIIISHPIIYAKLALKSIIQTIIGPGKEATYISIGLNNAELGLLDFKEYGLIELTILIFELLILAIIYLGSIYGFYLIIRGKKFLPLFLFIILMIYFIVLPAGAGFYYRFRIPVMPYIALISGVGFAGIRVLLESHKHKWSIDRK